MNEQETEIIALIYLLCIITHHYPMSIDRNKLARFVTIKIKMLLVNKLQSFDGENTGNHYLAMISDERARDCDNCSL